MVKESFQIMEGNEEFLCFKQRIGRRINLHVNEFYLECNGKKVNRLPDIRYPIKLVLRIPGGKGGFGSMLRAIGAQIEKTTNREACRDLSGRRLRDINEERRLKNWISQKEDKEKEVKERRKKKLESLCQEPKIDFTDTDYEQHREQLVENVSDSLEHGLKAGPSGSSNKRKSDTDSTTKNKKFKGMLLEIDIDDISSSESDQDECKAIEAEPLNINVH